MDTQRRKTAVATLSVASNAILVLGKVAIGLLIGSVSVISEAIHSGVDLLAAAIALFAVRKGAKPADEEHPFGHGKIENISGAVEALLIFLAAGWIVFEAIAKLRHPAPMETVGWGVLVMLVSSVLNFVVSSMLFKVGRETDSIALKADAWHLRTDVYTSAGVMAGLLVIWAGRRWAPGTPLDWLDPIFAIAVALLICKAAFDLTRQAVKDLLDARLPGNEEAWIRNCVVSMPQARGVRRLRTRKAGAERFVEIDVAVPSDMSVEDSHSMTEEIERAVVERFGAASVIVHVEPCLPDNCACRCVTACGGSRGPASTAE